MKSPSSGPITRSSGRGSGATTCTSSLRARSEAATSRPMKLAPRTTARLAVRGCRDDRLAVGEACGGSGRAGCPVPSPGGAAPGWPRWPGAARRTARCLPSSSRIRACLGLDRRYPPVCGRCRSPARDRTPADAAESSPRRGARQIVLGQIGPVIGRIGVGIVQVTRPSYPSRRSVSAALSPAAPAPTMTTESGGPLPTVRRSASASVALPVT